MGRPPAKGAPFPYGNICGELSAKLPESKALSYYLRRLAPSTGPAAEDDYCLRTFFPVLAEQPPHDTAKPPTNCTRNLLFRDFGCIKNSEQNGRAPNDAPAAPLNVSCE